MTKIDANYPVSVPSALPVSRRASSGPVAESTPVAAAAGAKDTAGVRTAQTQAPVQDAKVARLRAAVLDGSYQVDAQRIAGKLVDLDKQLP